jgi:hypothetical protein
VPDDKELQFSLRRQNAEAAVHNSEVIHARDKKLIEQGGFRVRDPKRTFERSFQPKFGDETHRVVHAQEGIVLDDQGRVYNSKFVRAVPSSSQSVTVNTKTLRGGNVLIQRKNAENLQSYKQRLLDFVPPEGLWEFQVAEYMKSIGMESVLKRGLNFRKALLLLGFTVNERGLVQPPQTVRRRLVGKQAV